MLVSRLRTPARTAALATASQSTSDSTAATPMDAMAVWATVFTALIPAAFHQKNIQGKRITPHKLRASAATNLAASGVSIQAIAKVFFSIFYTFPK